MTWYDATTANGTVGWQCALYTQNHHAQQYESVAALGGEDDAAGALRDADGADVWVLGLLQ